MHEETETPSEMKVLEMEALEMEASSVVGWPVKEYTGTKDEWEDPDTVGDGSIINVGMTQTPAVAIVSHKRVK